MRTGARTRSVVNSAFAPFITVEGSLAVINTWPTAFKNQRTDATIHVVKALKKSLVVDLATFATHDVGEKMQWKIVISGREVPC
jgi:S-methylmethionine-dependent homocysteine/selenocysteine methylase